MAFGKRVAAVAFGDIDSEHQRDGEVAPSRNPADPAEAPSMSAVDLRRPTALRDDLLRLHGQAAGLAGVVRSRAPLDPLLLEAATEPTSYPLLVEDFQRHFSHTDSGRLLHSVYCLAPAGEPDRAEPLLQIKLIELMGVVLELNRRCLSAHKDDALSIALQSDDMARAVDQVIVQSTVAAALLGTLVADQSRGPFDGALSAADLDRNRETIVAAIARTRSHMIEPLTFERHIPKLNWPAVVSERLVEPHPGERMINDVYAPADLARPEALEVPLHPSASAAVAAVA